MNIKEFYDKAIVQRLPIIREDIDFRKDLNNSITAFLENVKMINTDYFACDKEKQDVIIQIEKQAKLIYEIVDLYYTGQHANAFKKFKQFFCAPKGLLEYIRVYTVATHTTEQYPGEDEHITSQKVPTIWYRARIFENKEGHSFKEMFHIPLNKREIVNTQRYSAPGYPCLYLGNTIYSCWEEMHRPRFDDVMFSGFKVHYDFNVYDLRIPKQADFEKNLMKSLLCMPLIIACMIRVKSYNHPFKPEYIIPQLLIDTIICNNQKSWKSRQGPFDMTWGIIYTSTHISRDFPYGADYLENIALPVINSNDSKNYCEILASLFGISNPVCYEYEALKENTTRTYWKTVANTTPEEQLRTQYAESKMGYLEERIKKHSNFQVLDHYVVNTPKSGIIIPQNGLPVQTNIKASGSWKIETNK